MLKRNIKILGQDAGKRLDVFLAGKFSEKSRNFWQKKIKGGEALLNGRPAKAHEFLRENDIVEIAVRLRKKITSHESRIADYKLIFECPDYLIVEKPAGLLTHSDSKEPSLARQLVKDFPEIKKVGEAGRRGIVHRLDRDVSGLLVIARTGKFFNCIKKQFRERKIKKIYLALVYGKILKHEDVMRFAIGRGRGGRMAARPAIGDGKASETRFEVFKRFKNYTYLRVKILTGRTHQIRAHMLAYGHPIVGDKIYKLRRQGVRNPGCDRLFLHSHKLGFRDLKGEWMEYESRLPAGLEDCLKKLELVQTVSSCVQ